MSGIDGAPRGVWLDGDGFGPLRGVAVIGDDLPSLVLSDGVVREFPSGEIIGTDIFEALEQALAAAPESRWAGYMGYAARPDLTARSAPGLPDAVWMRLPDELAPSPTGPAVLPTEPPLESTPTPDWYRDAFDEVQRRLHAGDSYEVNLTHRVEVPSSLDPLAVYERLRAINPAPYAGYFVHADVHLVSASPECFVSIRDRRIETRPIKGTTPRVDDPDRDAAMRERLATDPRFRAENLMITDLMRNDLSQVCEVGSVVVPQLMQVESYAAVHQLVTQVEGRLQTGIGPVAAIRALFPAGSMTGAPKVRTMQIIDSIEASPRGIYSGAFGWISGSGDAELAVVIRSLVRAPDGTWSAGTGGGVTVNTTAEQEWAESEWKLGRLLQAL